MKGICKRILTIVTSLAIVMCLSVPVLAAETSENNTKNSESNYGVATCSNSYKGGGINVDSKSWKTIATSTTGFNCKVRVSSLGTSISTVDIRMLGKNGKVVWSQNESFGSLGSRDYWCGSDVYKIQVKYHTGQGTIMCYPVN